MRIGELSERSGVSRRSLRYWEQQGLLGSQRLSNGYREYAADSVQTVETIRSLLEVGLPTAVIRMVLPCTGDGSPQAQACGQLLDRVAEIRDDLDRKVTNLAANRDALTTYLRTAADTASLVTERG